MNGGESIKLRNDIVDPRGVITSVRSPFRDSFEDSGEEGWTGFESRVGKSALESKGSGMGGINVHRTVEISRVQESDEEEDGALENGGPSGSGIGRSDGDLV
jgi:hypothetical protein